MQDYVSNPLFTQGEVQQLRKILSEQIRSLEEDASISKNIAKNNSRGVKYDPGYSLEFQKYFIDVHWKDHFKARAKIKKLAALQVKLKSQDVLY